MASPLYALTHKDAEFCWGQPEEIAFHRLKQLLIKAPVLAFPNFDQEFILETDASGVGLGAILAQEQQGLLLMVTEHYNNMRRNMELPCWKLWAVKHFHHYCYGHHCHVYTDHEPYTENNKHNS